ncbi:hypothetical protein HN865_02670 [Candidatus Woesearchaeota archaeon]|jgi:hypothetical protein|nr:hypothetical protein [Candidatus Woesearchaeota archaeon]MBT7237739.1 hypothetical protein [Candidatus Woesearchaeota archaeon]
MKKGVLVLVLVILYSFSALAHEDLVVSHEVIQDKVLNEDEFVFKVTLENKRNVSDRFRFYSPSPFWEWIFNVEPKQIYIDAESSQEVILKLRPYEDKDPGNYGITLNVVSNNDSDILTEHSFDVEILDYDDIVDINLELPNVIDVDNDNLFRVVLNSNSGYVIPNITINLKSDYFDETGEMGILGEDSLESEFLIDFGQNVDAGEKDIHVFIYREDKLVMEKVQRINIAPSGNVQEVGTPEKGFLYNKETIEKVNNGNSISYETFTKKLSYFQKLFTSFSEEPTSIEKIDGYYVHEWSYSLNSGEGKIISIETDYREFVFILIGAIILVWLLYLYFKTDLRLIKRITSVQHSKEGVTTIGVLLVLKNKGMTKIRNIKLMDGMVNVVEKPSEFGSVKPSRIIRSTGGTKMMWNIPVIDSGSELFISYTVKVKAKVIGNLFVPNAIAKYVKSKRRRVIKSNKVKIFS